MYALATQLNKIPVISLQTGEVVATVRSPLLDAGRLQIVGLFCMTMRRKSRSLMLTVGDVREITSDCIIIDTEDDLTEAEDIVRLAELMATGQDFIGRTVVSDAGRKVGRVEDFTIDIDTFRIQKLYVQRSILQSLSGSSVIIDRSQVMDVSAERIVVRETTITVPTMSEVAIRPST